MLPQPTGGCHRINNNDTVHNKSNNWQAAEIRWHKCAYKMWKCCTVLFQQKYGTCISVCKCSCMCVGAHTYTIEHISIYICIGIYSAINRMTFGLPHTLWYFYELLRATTNTHTHSCMQILVYRMYICALALRSIWQLCYFLSHCTFLLQCRCNIYVCVYVCVSAKAAYVLFPLLIRCLSVTCCCCACNVTSFVAYSLIEPSKS